MAHRKWKESKQQPSMLPGPAVPGCCLISFYFLWAIHPIRPVLGRIKDHLSALFNHGHGPLSFGRNLVVLPGDVPARREADERHLRASGVLHRDLLLRRVRRPPHKDQPVRFVHALATLGTDGSNVLMWWDGG